MKLRLSSHRRDGSAVLVLLVVLSIILAFVAANLRVIHQLGREVSTTEQKQLRHWEKRGVEQ